jgi:hypothetical protein
MVTNSIFAVKLHENVICVQHYSDLVCESPFERRENNLHRANKIRRSGRAAK